MNQFVEELKKTGTFFVATEEDGQPRVRPFGSCCEFEGSAYICTNNQKDCYRQMADNPKVEICGVNEDGSWIRIQAEAVRDDRDEARAAMLADPTGPSQLYQLGDGIFEVLKLTNVTGMKYSFTSEPQPIG